MEIENDRMTLSATIGSSSETVVISANMGSLDQVLETIERFIRASGYHPEGQLTFLIEDH